jgi:hypothetical protein
MAPLKMGDGIIPFKSRKTIEMAAMKHRDITTLIFLDSNFSKSPGASGQGWVSVLKWRIIFVGAAATPP